MRVSDYIEQSFSNLWKKKLRTFLTTFGVTIGIGAFVTMLAFGKGVQKNLTEQFKEMDLFNYVSVFNDSEEDEQSPEQHDTEEENAQQATILDDEFILKVMRLKGVEMVFPEIRFPAQIRFEGKEEFLLVQVLPVNICKTLKLRTGSAYSSNDVNSLVINDSILHRMNTIEFEKVIGKTIEVSTLTADAGLFNPANIASVMQGDMLPFSTESYTFTIAGVAERMGFGGPIPIRSEIFIPPGPAEKMKKMMLTSIWELFRSSQPAKGYSAVNIKLTSPRYVDPVKATMKEWGLRTFALVDQLAEIKKVFIFMDMFLFAVGMIAITVASLGIINTMVMSVLERYKEIGVMKAIGASDKDVKKIFFFESGVIGISGGIFGLALGWLVSSLINQIINVFTAREGVPYIDYFSFPWWLCVGAVIFSTLISLVAGIYPAVRAARVDPVVALRHD